MRAPGAAGGAAWRLAAALAGLGGTAAIAAAVAAVLAGPGTRLGLWPFPTGFAILRWSALLALAAAALSLLGIVLSARARDGRAVVLAIVGLAVGVVTAGGLWQAAQRARAVPPIHDVTTDTEDPPAFVAVAVLAVRAGAPNPIEYGGPVIAALQRRGYPDLRPADFAAPPGRVFAAAEAAARRLGWRVVATAPAEGRLEATATTFWFGFQDDVVVRVRARGAGSRVDVRSVSRVGHGDLGANAARIRRFLATLREGGLPPAPAP